MIELTSSCILLFLQITLTCSKQGTKPEGNVQSQEMLDCTYNCCITILAN